MESFYQIKGLRVLTLIAVMILMVYGRRGLNDCTIDPSALLLSLTEGYMNSPASRVVAD